jgi:hypothetical protein
VPIDLWERTVGWAFTASVNTAQWIKSSHLFNGGVTAVAVAWEMISES